MNYEEYLNNKRLYQEFGSTFLIERKHACLYYKPGKGKTYPCIDALRDIDKDKNGKANVLILSTADAINNMWKTEIAPQGILPQHTILMTFKSAIVDARAQWLLGVKWDVIVVDECHKVKSNSSKISKLVYKLSKHCPYVWGLSGTPRGNSDVDIYCQFHNLHISQWGDVSYTMFTDMVCICDMQFFRGNKIKKPIGIRDEYRVGWENNIAQYTQRIDYVEEDDMPELNVNTVMFKYEKTKVYKDAEAGILQIGDDATTMTKLAALTKLHQIANGFVYYTPEDEANTKIEWLTDNAKLDYIVKNVNEPTVVVYRFKGDLMSITNRLKKENISFTDNIDMFKAGNANVLLLQCSRCESFNLQMCSHMIFYTLDYSFIKYDQMLHRVWRMGQESVVKIEVLLCEDTIEENIWAAVSNKQRLSELFMKVKESCNG